MNDEVPEHSTFSKNRHGRFKESGIFQEIFDEIVRQCIACGLVSGKHLTVDGTLVKANASLPAAGRFEEYGADSSADEAQRIHEEDRRREPCGGALGAG